MRGVRHTEEVQAESLFEAAILGVRTFKGDPWVEQVGPATVLEIEVREPPPQTRPTSEDPHQAGHDRVRKDCEKQKDADAFDPIELVRYTMQLDDVVDEQGEPETSCVIRLASEPEMNILAAKGDTARRNKILKFIKSAPGCTKNQVVKAIGGRSIDVYEMIDALIKEQKVVNKGKEGGTAKLSIVDAPLFVGKEPQF